jgi:thiol-disulfide isomerase/thioredoxin
MRNASRLALASIVLALAAGRGLAQEAAGPVTLKIGDAAPALKVGKWVKGEPVEKFAPGTVYVIECWATWCGPCKQAIPHVTELQKKFEGKVVFIGVDVWEQNDELVEPFVKEMGEKMNYRVVMDDKATDKTGLTAKNWLAAAGQNGIPCSFIVNQEGKVAWIGHPMQIESVLEKVVDGKFDIKSAESDAKTQQELAEKVQAAQMAIGEAAQRGDVDAVVKAIDKLAVDVPAFKPQSDVIKFQVLLFQMKQYEKGYALADKAFEAVKDDPAGLNSVAWNIATAEGIEKRDMKVAQKFAERAVEVTKRADSAVLDTLARVLFDQGQVAKAVEVETEAVGKIPADAPAELRTELAANLATYTAASKAPTTQVAPK